MTTRFNDRPASRLVERALRAEAFLLQLVAPGCSRAEGPDVGHWILSRIASLSIIDRGLFEQSAGPLLHQMLNVNHLLTMWSPNANHSREFDHVGPCDPTEVDAFFGRSYLSFVCQAVGSRCGCPTRSKTMLGKNDLVDNLSRDLDRARGKRDALASDVTTLTAQIAEIEARLDEEKNRRERDRVIGQLEAIKKRIKQTASAFSPVIRELCEASEIAAAVVPEARELNSFLISVATEVDVVIDPLLRELDRRADAVRVGHAALDLPCLADESPVELPKDDNDRLLRFPKWLSPNKEAAKGETAENPRSTAA
jgi:hypothetical protein